MPKRNHAPALCRDVGEMLARLSRPHHTRTSVPALGLAALHDGRVVMSLPPHAYLVVDGPTVRIGWPSVDQAACGRQRCTSAVWGGVL